MFEVAPRLLAARQLRRTLLTKDFADFVVPTELVAQRPAEPRESARLMVLRRTTGEIEHHRVSDLPNILGSEWSIVVNNSKVIRCRLKGQWDCASSQSLDAVYLLEQIASNFSSCANAGSIAYKVSGEAVAAMPIGTQFSVSSNKGTASVTGTKIAHSSDGSCDGVMAFVATEDQLNDLSQTPLPPYIEPSNVGEAAYQTLFAEQDGSVAAPTAGLHFTPRLVSQLESGGCAFENVTLHVGYGTFGHVQTEKLTDHAMHHERYFLDTGTAARLNLAERLLAVGTTATRTLETCAGKSTGRGRGLSASVGETNLFIYPGYQFKAVDALLTNFHMPGLTPIMLVAAFAGHDLVRHAYAEAIEQRYRFFSFGDAMLIL